MSIRYKKLNGDAIHEPLYKSFHQSSGIKLTGLLFAINAATIATVNDLPPLETCSHIGLLLAGYGAGEVMIRGFNERKLSRLWGKTNKCIDTAPDGSTVPTNPTDYAKAKTFLKERSYILGGVLLNGVVLAAIQGNIHYPVALGHDVAKLMTDPSTSPMSALALAAMGRITQTCYSYYKIVKGDHVIVDTPKPEEKKVTEAKFSPLFSPT